MKTATKSPACRRGSYSGVDFALRFQLTPQSAGQTDQACAQKGQAPRFRNDNVRIAAGDRRGSAEESLAGVDGQLHRYALCARTVVPRARKRTRQGVIVGAIS